MLDDLLCLRLPHGAGDAGGDHADPTPTQRGARVGGPCCEPAPECSLRPAGRGHRLSHRQGPEGAFDEIKALRAKGLERRADNLPPADERCMASVLTASDRFANSLLRRAATRMRARPRTRSTPSTLTHAYRHHPWPALTAPPSPRPPRFLHQRLLHRHALFERSKPFVGAAGPVAVAVDA